MRKGVMKLDEKKSLFEQVEEREVQGEIFQVTHRLLKVPKTIYLEAVKGFAEPFSEVAVQDFVEQYLRWCGDREGVIGMVRFDEEEGYVILDAAVRYRINPRERPSCRV